MRHSEKIELLDQSLFIYERNASDVLALEASFKIGQFEGNNGSIGFMNQQAIIIRDSVKYNWENLPWWKFFRKIKLRRTFTLTNIINKLSQKEILSIAKKVLQIEGTESPYHKYLLGEITAEKFAESVKKKAEELALLGSMQ